MGFVLSTIVSYLLFNVAIWVSLGQGGLIAMGIANGMGAIATTLSFREQIREQGARPNWPKALLGAVGIVGIVVGLSGSHRHLPVSLSIEAVYNGFACLSWPLFVLLNLRWSRWFQERPNQFDLMCHCLMALMVMARFATYGGSFAFQLAGLVWIGVAITGYMLFNISIKLAAGHRATNIAMNAVGAGLLVAAGLWDGDWSKTSMSVVFWGGALMGGAAIFGIVKSLGESYLYFGKLGHASLVAPLVYDGILVASPSVMLLTGETPSHWTLLVALGMLAITVARYRHHMMKKK